MYLVAGKDYLSNLDRRERKYLDKPGDNSGRGWSGLGLRTQQAQSLTMVSAETRALLFKNSFVSFTADPEDDLMEDEEKATDTESAVTVCIWESPEELFLETYHCFGKDGQLIADLTPGAGQAMVAACRMGKRYLGFAHNRLHVDYLKEAVP